MKGISRKKARKTTPDGSKEGKTKGIKVNKRHLLCSYW